MERVRSWSYFTHFIVLCYFRCTSLKWNVVILLVIAFDVDGTELLNEKLNDLSALWRCFNGYYSSSLAKHIGNTTNAHILASP